MAVKPFSKEELNFFKFSSIVLDEFPKAIRQIFITMWDNKIAVLPGYQTWDDSPAVRNMLLNSEGGKTKIPTNKSIHEWDCTALFQATIHAKTFSSSSGKTLNDLYLKKMKPAPGCFHASVISVTGNQDETLALAIDQLRLLVRNTLCYSKPFIAKVDFDLFVQLAKDALAAAKVTTTSVDTIGGLTEDDFPTVRVNELNECRLKELQAINRFLQGNMGEKIRDINDRTREMYVNYGELKDTMCDIDDRTRDIHANHGEMKDTMCDIDDRTRDIHANHGDMKGQRKVLWTKTSIKHRDKFEKLVNVLETEPEKATKIGTYSVCLNSDFDIGHGSDGTTVYIGLCDDGMEVAVKSLLLDRCEHLGSNEKEILNYVKVRKEQHIVNYRFYTVDSRNVYLILDLCEETLEKYVLSAESSKAMLESKGVTFLRQILLGLKALHCGDPEILHRDIKPSNIFVNVEGELVLADFGISRKLIKGQTTYRSGQKGTLGWIAVESLPTEDEGDCLSIEEEKVRYKKQSDIQVTGMVLFYILTKGKHPYGKSDSRRHLHLSEGKPVNLNNVSDPLAKDLIEWMLQHDLKERPGVEECLKHPYLMSTDEMFHFVTRVGNELEIKTKDVTSVVVTQLNADLSLPKPSWKATIDTEVMSYMSGHRVYSDDVADLLRFIRNTAEHWGDKTPPTTVQAKVGTPKEYFLNLFPTLPVVLHRIIRKNPVWKQREQLKQFF